MQNVIPIRRTILILFAAALAAGAALAAAPKAQATHDSRRTPDNVYIATEFGHQYRVGADNLNAGTAVKQVSPLAGRILDMVDKGNDPNGYPLKRVDFSNNNIMAANNDCNGVTIKSDPNATGSIWIIYLPGDGHLYMVPRACNNGDYDKRMGADNTLGHQWEIKGSPPPSGFYEKLVLDLG